jgi:hypothetical protein
MPQDIIKHWTEYVGGDDFRNFPNKDIEQVIGFHRDILIMDVTPYGYVFVIEISLTIRSFKGERLFHFYTHEKFGFFNNSNKQRQKETILRCFDSATKYFVKALNEKDPTRKLTVEPTGFPEAESVALFNKKAGTYF